MAWSILATLQSLQLWNWIVGLLQTTIETARGYISIHSCLFGKRRVRTLLKIGTAYVLADPSKSYWLETDSANVLSKMARSPNLRSLFLDFEFEPIYLPEEHGTAPPADIAYWMRRFQAMSILGSNPEDSEETSGSEDGNKTNQILMECKKCWNLMEMRRFSRWKLMESHGILGNIRSQ